MKMGGRAKGRCDLVRMPANSGAERPTPAAIHLSDTIESDPARKARNVPTPSEPSYSRDAAAEHLGKLATAKPESADA
jgi:hypothetical protein